MNSVCWEMFLYMGRFPVGEESEWGSLLFFDSSCLFVILWLLMVDNAPYEWILAQKLSIARYKIQFAKHMKLKMNEDQSVDTAPS